MTSTDGDAIFAQAALTCARGLTPRDGGQALAALADWLQERFDEGESWVGVADPTVSGMALVVMCWRGNDYPFRCFLASEDGGGEPICDRAAFSTFSGSEEGDDFRGWLAEQLDSHWRHGRP